MQMTADRLAAVDLGSNSFRLEIARLELGQLQRMEYHKETVRQGAGLDAERRLSHDAMQRGWNCLARFAQRLRGHRAHLVGRKAGQPLGKAGQAVPPALHGVVRQATVGVQPGALAHGLLVVFHALELSQLQAGDFKAKAVGAQVHSRKTGAGLHR